jgi:hypothetical protein
VSDALTQAKDKLKRILTNHRLYTQNFLKIKTKAGAIVPFKYNQAQNKLDRIWSELEAQKKPIRIILLKVRQFGGSTYILGRGFHQAATGKNQHVKIVAHEDDGTDNLFQMCVTFYQNLPDTIELVKDVTAQIKPLPKYSNRKELVFSDRGSRITLKTAGKDTEEKGSSVGRSQTVNFLECSEVAFWPAAKNTFTSLLQTVPDLPGTVVAIESTANGIGDYFYTLWQDAKKGINGFIPVFIAWWEHDEYETPLNPGEILAPYDEEEKSLKKRFNLSDAKLKWRRQAIKIKCQGKVEIFHQEYPSDDQEAFLVSGRPYFNVDSLVKIKDNYQKEPIKRGNLEWIDSNNKVNGGVKWIDNEDGFISIWSEPKPLGCYCIGGDVAEGLEKGDFSSLDVLDRDEFRQAAKWHGHIDADLFGEESVKLALYFNKAWLGDEVNNHGLTTNKTIAKLRYPRMYIRKVLDEREPDPTDKLGWQTNTQSRPLMLDEMEKAIREDGLILHSETTISECFSFVRNSKGKPEAQEGCFDDSVISMAITIQMHKLCPMSRPNPKEADPLAHRNDYHQREKRRKGPERASEATGY